MKPEAALTAFCVLVAALVAGAALAFTCQAQGADDERVYTAIRVLPRCYADRDLPPEQKEAQLRNVARAIATATKNRAERTLLVSIAHHESGICHDIQAGFCAARECDPDRHGIPRARSIYQTHQLGLNDADWDALVGTDYDATLLATRHALKIVRRSYALCKNEIDPIRATFLAYAGKGCRGQMKDLGYRMGTFGKVWDRL